MIKVRRNGIFVKLAGTLYRRKNGFFIKTAAKIQQLPANIRQWRNGLWIAAKYVSVWKNTNQLVAFFQ